MSIPAVHSKRDLDTQVPNSTKAFVLRIWIFIFVLLWAVLILHFKYICLRHSEYLFSLALEILLETFCVHSTDYDLNYPLGWEMQNTFIQL